LTRKTHRYGMTTTLGRNKTRGTIWWQEEATRQEQFEDDSSKTGTIQQRQQRQEQCDDEGNKSGTIWWKEQDRTMIVTRQEAYSDDRHKKWNIQWNNKTGTIWWQKEEDRKHMIMTWTRKETYDNITRQEQDDDKRTKTGTIWQR